MVNQYSYLVYFGIYGTHRDGSVVKVEANTLVYTDKPIESMSCGNEEKRKFVDALTKKLESDARRQDPNILSCTIIIKNII